jgi:hypothetical protein
LTGRYDGKIPTLVRHDYESKRLLQNAERSTTCVRHVYNDRRLHRGEALEYLEVLALVGDIALQMEVTVTASLSYLTRRHDPQSCLALIDIRA